MNPTDVSRRSSFGSAATQVFLSSASTIHQQHQQQYVGIGGGGTMSDRMGSLGGGGGAAAAATRAPSVASTAAYDDAGSPNTSVVMLGGGGVGVGNATPPRRQMVPRSGGSSPDNSNTNAAASKRVVANGFFSASPARPTTAGGSTTTTSGGGYYASSPIRPSTSSSSAVGGGGKGSAPYTAATMGGAASARRSTQYHHQHEHNHNRRRQRASSFDLANGGGADHPPASRRETSSFKDTTLGLQRRRHLDKAHILCPHQLAAVERRAEAQRQNLSATAGGGGRTSRGGGGGGVSDDEGDDDETASPSSFASLPTEEGLSFDGCQLGPRLCPYRHLPAAVIALLRRPLVPNARTVTRWFWRENAIRIGDDPCQWRPFDEEWEGLLERGYVKKMADDRRMDQQRSTRHLLKSFLAATGGGGSGGDGGGGGGSPPRAASTFFSSSPSSGNNTTNSVVVVNKTLDYRATPFTGNKSTVGSGAAWRGQHQRGTDGRPADGAAATATTGGGGGGGIPLVSGYSITAASSLPLWPLGSSGMGSHVGTAGSPSSPHRQSPSSSLRRPSNERLIMAQQQQQSQQQQFSNVPDALAAGRDALRLRTDAFGRRSYASDPTGATGFAANAVQPESAGIPSLLSLAGLSAAERRRRAGYAERDTDDDDDDESTDDGGGRGGRRPLHQSARKKRGGGGGGSASAFSSGLGEEAYAGPAIENIIAPPYHFVHKGTAVDLGRMFLFNASDNGQRRPIRRVTFAAMPQWLLVPEYSATVLINPSPQQECWACDVASTASLEFYYASGRRSAFVMEINGRPAFVDLDTLRVTFLPQMVPSLLTQGGGEAEEDGVAYQHDDQSHNRHSNRHHMLGATPPPQAGLVGGSASFEENTHTDGDTNNPDGVGRLLRRRTSYASNHSGEGLLAASSSSDPASRLGSGNSLCDAQRYLDASRRHAAGLALRPNPTYSAGVGGGGGGGSSHNKNSHQQQPYEVPLALRTTMRLVRQPITITESPHASDLYDCPFLTQTMSFMTADGNVLHATRLTNAANVPDPSPLSVITNPAVVDWLETTFLAPSADTNQQQQNHSSGDASCSGSGSGKMNSRGDAPTHTVSNSLSLVTTTTTSTNGIAAGAPTAQCPITNSGHSCTQSVYNASHLWTFSHKCTFGNASVCYLCTNARDEARSLATFSGNQQLAKALVAAAAANSNHAAVVGENDGGNGSTTAAAIASLLAFAAASSSSTSAAGLGGSGGGGAKGSGLSLALHPSLRPCHRRALLHQMLFTHEPMARPATSGAQNGGGDASTNHKRGSTAFASSPSPSSPNGRGNCGGGGEPPLSIAEINWRRSQTIARTALKFWEGVTSEGISYRSAASVTANGPSSPAAGAPSPSSPMASSTATAAAASVVGNPFTMLSLTPDTNVILHNVHVGSEEGQWVLSLLDRGAADGSSNSNANALLAGLGQNRPVASTATAAGVKRRPRFSGLRIQRIQSSILYDRYLRGRNEAFKDAFQLQSRTAEGYLKTVGGGGGDDDDDDDDEDDEDEAKARGNYYREALAARRRQHQQTDNTGTHDASASARRRSHSRPSSASSADGNANRPRAATPRQPAVASDANGGGQKGMGKEREAPPPPLASPSFIDSRDIILNTRETVGFAQCPRGLLGNVLEGVVSKMELCTSSWLAMRTATEAAIATSEGGRVEFAKKRRERRERRDEERRRRRSAAAVAMDNAVDGRSLATHLATTPPMAPPSPSSTPLHRSSFSSAAGGVGGGAPLRTSSLLLRQGTAPHQHHQHHQHRSSSSLMIAGGGGGDGADGDDGSQRAVWADGEYDWVFRNGHATPMTSLAMLAAAGGCDIARGGIPMLTPPPSSSSRESQQQQQQHQHRGGGGDHHHHHHNHNQLIPSAPPAGGVARTYSGSGFVNGTMNSTGAAAPPRRTSSRGVVHVSSYADGQQHQHQTTTTTLNTVAAGGGYSTATPLSLSAAALRNTTNATAATAATTTSEGAANDGHGDADANNDDDGEMAHRCGGTMSPKQVADAAATPPSATLGIGGLTSLASQQQQQQHSSRPPSRGGAASPSASADTATTPLPLGGGASSLHQSHSFNANGTPTPINAMVVAGGGGGASSSSLRRREDSDAAYKQLKRTASILLGASTNSNRRASSLSRREEDLLHRRQSLSIASTALNEALRDEVKGRAESYAYAQPQSLIHPHHPTLNTTTNNSNANASGVVNGQNTFLEESLYSKGELVEAIRGSGAIASSTTQSPIPPPQSLLLQRGGGSSGSNASAGHSISMPMGPPRLASFGGRSVVSLASPAASPVPPSPTLSSSQHMKKGNKVAGGRASASSTTPLNSTARMSPRQQQQRAATPSSGGGGASPSPSPSRRARRRRAEEEALLARAAADERRRLRREERRREREGAMRMLLVCAAYDGLSLDVTPIANRCSLGTAAALAEARHVSAWATPPLFHEETMIGAGAGDGDGDGDGLGAGSHVVGLGAAVGPINVSAFAQHQQSSLGIRGGGSNSAPVAGVGFSPRPPSSVLQRTNTTNTTTNGANHSLLNDTASVATLLSTAGNNTLRRKESSVVMVLGSDDDGGDAGGQLTRQRSNLGGTAARLSIRRPSSVLSTATPSSSSAFRRPSLSQHHQLLLSAYGGGAGGDDLRGPSAGIGSGGRRRGAPRPRLEGSNAATRDAATTALSHPPQYQTTFISVGGGGGGGGGAHSSQSDKITTHYSGHTWYPMYILLYNDREGDGGSGGSGSDVDLTNSSDEGEAS